MTRTLISFKYQVKTSILYQLLCKSTNYVNSWFINRARRLFWVLKLSIYEKVQNSWTPGPGLRINMLCIYQLFLGIMCRKFHLNDLKTNYGRSLRHKLSVWWLQYSISWGYINNALVYSPYLLTSSLEPKNSFIHILKEFL